MPSPTSTSEDSEDDLDKNTSLDESFDSGGSIKSTSLPSLYVVACLSIVFSLLFAGLGGPVHVTRWHRDRQHSIREASSLASSLKTVSTLLESHVHHSLPPMPLTTASSDGRGSVKFHTSTSDLSRRRPLALYFGMDSSAFADAANQAGYAYGVAEGKQHYWDLSRPFPSSPSGFTGLFAAASTACDENTECGGVDGARVYVLADTEGLGRVTFKVEGGVWEEVRVRDIGGLKEELILLK